MPTQPQLMSRPTGKTFEFGYLFPDEPATIYLNAERKGGRYYYAHAAHLVSDGWSERRDSRTMGPRTQPKDSPRSPHGKNCDYHSGLASSGLAAVAFEHLDDHLCPALPELPEKMRHVMSDRVVRKSETLGDLLIGQPGHHKIQYSDLLRG